MSNDPGDRELLPVACTLGAEDGTQRVQDWRTVVQGLGAGSRREPGHITLHFRDAPDVEGELTRLVDAERGCCAFLGWDLARTDDGWAVRISGTDDELAALSLGDES
jgi:hypothetical protein